MTWKIDSENVAESNWAAEFLQGVIVSIVAFWVLVINRAGPNWIKCFIFSLFFNYVILTIKASLRIWLIVKDTEDHLLKTLLESISFVLSYIHRQIFFITMILFTLFYWVNAKYNEHVIKFGTTNPEDDFK